MEIVKVYSPVEDKNIRKNLNESPIWKNSIHADDIAKEQESHNTIWEYEIKFDGLKPIQVTDIKRYK